MNLINDLKFATTPFLYELNEWVAAILFILHRVGCRRIADDGPKVLLPNSLQLVDPGRHMVCWMTNKYIQYDHVRLKFYNFRLCLSKSYMLQFNFYDPIPS